jgi:hypothetical protein
LDLDGGWVYDWWRVGTLCLCLWARDVNLLACCVCLGCTPCVLEYCTPWLLRSNHRVITLHCSAGCGEPAVGTVALRVTTACHVVAAHVYAGRTCQCWGVGWHYMCP